ncbi:MAG: V-type ATP synthase subunit F [Candidatus Bipolaricaulia bacterium]
MRDKPVIVTDSDLADGFRLAGVTVFEIDPNEAQLNRRIEEIATAIAEMEDVAIVLVDERYIDQFEARIGGDGELPILASLPLRKAESGATYVERLTRRYLGRKIYT